MTRPSASWLRDQLRKIEREKKAHVKKWGAARSEQWHADYQDAITACH